MQNLKVVGTEMLKSKLELIAAVVVIFVADVWSKAMAFLCFLYLEIVFEFDVLHFLI